MASENAAAVAHAVIEKVRNGKKVSKRQIIRSHGYAPSVANAPTKVTETQSYQSVIQPFVQKLIERDAAIKRMTKVRAKAKYRDLTDAIDKLPKNIQLLTGGSHGQRTAHRSPDIGRDSK